MTGYIDIYETAKKLSYHPQTVRHLARTGKIRAVKRRAKWFFLIRDIERFFLNADSTSHTGTRAKVR